jgi:hypothetical protein
MERRGEEVHIEIDEARAGVTNHGVRWVLGISLTLALIAMSAVWIIPSLTQGSTIDESDRTPVQVDAARSEEDQPNRQAP